MEPTNFVGRKFGRLLVLAFIGKRRYGTSKPQQIYNCRCDCGGQIEVPRSSLTSALTQSCGCLAREGTVARNKERSNPDSAFRNLLHRYKKTAASKGLIFSLTDEEFRTLTSSPCAYTGRLPSRVVYNKSASSRYVYNGIDRVENDKGYIVGNCVACCYEANSAKSTLTYEQFLSLCRDVVAHSRKRDALPENL